MRQKPLPSPFAVAKREDIQERKLSCRPKGDISFSYSHCAFQSPRRGEEE